MNDKKRTEVSNKLMDAARCVSKDNIGCILNDALHGEEKLSGVNENCSVCCSVSLAELADLVKPSYDRDVLLTMAKEMVETFRLGAFTGEGLDAKWCRELHDKYDRRIHEALGDGVKLD